jgi:hypothetical protein
MSFDYVVKIRDVDENFVKLQIHYSWWDRSGNWFTLTKGALSYNAGACYGIFIDGTLATNHLYLYDENNKWGIRLKEFSDFWGINDSGPGTLVQPWCITMTPRKINWYIEKEL